MKKTPTIFTLIFTLIFVFNNSKGQTYNISNAPITTCSGTYYDTGGSAGVYLNSESYTQTFTPSVAGNKMRFTFTSFDTESCCDHLSIYDGPNILSPLIGTFQGIISPGTVTATNATGQLTFVWTSDASVTPTGWAATISCYSPGPMTYVSCTTTQGNITSVSPGSTSQEIVGVQIVTTGSTAPISTTSFSFNTTGTTNALGDISNAKLWYTGTTGTFATTTQVGATIAAPNGVFTFAPAQALLEGTNYFWLTYDIKPAATVGNVVDAVCSSLTVGVARTPTVTAPAGSRPILATYLMNNTPVTTCVGDFYDTGGALGDYLISESYTKTFTPAVVGNKMRLTFTAFSTESCCDHLSIYDGPTTLSPLIGTYQGVISPGTITATSATGELTVVWTSDGSINSSGWAATVSCFVPAAMSYVSCTTTQGNVTSVSPGSVSQEIVAVQIVTTGSLTPLSATSFSFNTTGCTNALGDIQNAKLWYTGLTGTFTTTTQVGATVAAPNGVFTFAPAQVLLEGTNYFWLTYDIKPGATVGNVVDAVCSSLTVGVARTPTVTAPAGSRPILAIYLMNNTPVTTCAGSFYDTGGSTGDYVNSESFTKTFTPAIIGSKVRLTFNTFSTESCCDHLSIYDGPTILSPLIGTYQGVISPGIITATSATGELTLVWTSDGSVISFGWDATISCYTPAPMVYISSTTTQNPNPTYQSLIHQDVIGIQVVTTGSLTPFSATSFSLNTIGSTNALGDIQNAKLWYTGLSPTFAATSQIGTTVAAPNGAFTFTPAQVLLEGTNYFWLTYDIKATATIGNVVDATCGSITIGGIARVPTITAPAGSRPIVDCPCGTGYVNAGNLAAPYSSGAQTTCGQVDNITGLNVTTICNSSLYYGGEDVVYYFVPSTSGYVTINVTSAGTNMGAMLYAGCPLTGGTCVAAAQSAAGNQTIGVCVTAGVKYFLIIDSWPAPACNPYSLTISVPTGGGPPANDEPCGATTLVVNPGSVLWVTGNTQCATPSQILQPGLAVPGCGNYQGGDIWFKFTVPASGKIIVDMNTAGSLTDMDMAWYTSTTSSCLNLNTLVECDDFDSQNGVFAMICHAGAYCMVPGDCQQNSTLTPGSTVWVRVWQNGNTSMGDFLIGAYEPGSPGATSDCPTATVIGSIPYTASGLTTCCKVNDYTSANACLSSYMNGEDYVFKYTPAVNQTVNITITGTGPNVGLFVIDNCPNVVGANCIAQSSNAAGNPDLCAVNLIAGTTYYIIVDTWPIPNCTSFNININNSAFATCGMPYTVATIPHAPGPYTGGAINIPIDDTFSPIYVPIGFPFCFDGIQYSQCLVSSNAYVIFDPIACTTNLPGGINAAPNAYSAWSISAAIPNTTNAPRNSIMFPWMDVNPALGGNVTFNTTGVTPNRKFYVTFDAVPLFSCTTNQLTSQLILYETTNRIEVHMARKDACAGWNAGTAILGLHNYNGTQAVVPAGYNYPTAWTATNQAWRFSTTCAQCFNPLTLPIDLLEFDGVNEGLKNKLFWKTSSETNNDYFSIEKFVNFEYVEIGKVKGAGNSNTIKEYEFLDNDVTETNSYYRLKQFDFNGKSEYSNIISVRKPLSFKQALYPNPASDLVVVSLPNDAAIVMVEIFNNVGQTVMSKKIEVNSSVFEIEMPDIKNGIYNIKVSDLNGSIILLDKLMISHK